MFYLKTVKSKYSAHFVSFVYNAVSRPCDANISDWTYKDEICPAKSKEKMIYCKKKLRHLDMILDKTCN